MEEEEIDTGMASSGSEEGEGEGEGGLWAGPSTTLTETGVRFYPPAGVQRYGAAADFLASHPQLQEHRPNKVVDLGCGELALFRYLKHVPGVRHVVAVDYNRHMLMEMHKVAQPLIFDEVIKRSEPLQVDILYGSACEPDRRLLDADVVFCIELIEHLDPGVLDRLPHNIFGYIKPRFAFISTPNVEFNVLFPNLRDGGVRIPDHRFEWDRQQFQDWANNLCSRYPEYTVEFSGIAPGPAGTEHLGCCTQCAIFIRRQPESQESNSHKRLKTDTNGSCDHNGYDYSSIENCDFEEYQAEKTEESRGSFDNINWEVGANEMPYKVIQKYVYKYTIQNVMSEEEQLLRTALNRLNIYSYREDEEDEHGLIRIPLADLLAPEKEATEAVLEQLRELLVEKKYKIEDGILVYDRYERSESSESSDLNYFDAESTPYVNAGADEPRVQEECWDLEAPMPPPEVQTPVEVNPTLSVQPLTTSTSNDVLYDLSEGCRSTSPLANFFAKTDEEHKLSDSGYTKSQSQDSPQSPVCSDTFSNDLITPDRDLSDMTPANILECIPENLNCLTVQKESRRRSIGHGVNCEQQHPEQGPGRPKSLHVFRSSDGYHPEAWDTPSDIKDSPLIPDLSPDNNLFVNNMRPLDFLLANNAEDARMMRPDFLDIQNVLGLQNRDRINNNLDLEGNNVRGDNDDPLFIEEDNNIMEDDFPLDENDDALLLQRHLDRHNENHLIEDVNNGADLPDDEDIVLQYQENVEDDGNNEFYNRGQSPTDSTYPPESVSSFADDRTEELLVDDLISSIEQTLSLEEPTSFDKDDIEQLRSELSDIDLKSNLYIPGIGAPFPQMPPGSGTSSGQRPIFYVDSDNSLSEGNSLKGDAEFPKKSSEENESATSTDGVVKFVL